MDPSLRPFPAILFPYTLASGLFQCLDKWMKLRTDAAGAILPQQIIHALYSQNPVNVQISGLGFKDA